VKNPLNNLPLNSKRVYVMAKTPKGCEIYMPVNSFNDEHLTQKKIDLQIWLNETYSPPAPGEPMVA
jgi:hypothetical protein